MKYVPFGVVLTFTTFASAETLPVPPVPPDHLPQVEAAPVPNVDATEPVPPASEDPRLNVKFYRADTYLPGSGFTPGSRYQDSEERKPIQTPGINFLVPLK